MSGDVVAAQVWLSTATGTLLNLPHRRTSEAQSLPCDLSLPYANTWQPGLSFITTFSLVAPMKFYGSLLMLVIAVYKVIVQQSPGL